MCNCIDIVAILKLTTKSQAKHIQRYSFLQVDSEMKLMMIFMFTTSI